MARKLKRWSSITRQLCGSMWIQSGLIAFIAFVTIFCFASWRTRSSIRAWQYLQGQRLFLPKELHFDNAVLGTEKVTAELHVLNASVRPIHLIGANKSCPCIGLNDFPIVVPVGREVQVNVTIELPQKLDDYSQSFKFYSEELIEGSSLIEVKGSVVKH